MIASRISLAVGTLVVTAPLAVLTTFLLLPLWRLAEARWGVEAVGHASISGWCFAVTYAVLVLPALVRTQQRLHG